MPDDREALLRAAKLIDWMVSYIGKMAPGSYSECYSDLNQHFLYMEKLDREKLHALG